jgi:hypothetical protein
MCPDHAWLKRNSRAKVNRVSKRRG